MTSRALPRRAVAAAAMLALAGLAGIACTPAPPVRDVDAVAALAGRATLAGPTIDAAALHDKVVVINFWSPG